MPSYGVPPKELMLSLKEEFSVERFLETGTHLGRTTAWAAAHFAEVVTIEASEELQQAAIEKRGRLSNVRWVLGDTREVLPAEIGRLDGPAIVWLDSHWSGGLTYGEDSQCPLLAEIAAVRATEHEHYLFIDDARLFLAPPPPPHEPDQWPTLTEVVSTLNSGDRPLDVMLLYDTFVAVPRFARDHVRRYAQNVSAAASA
jgi:hypothetical protein